MMLVVAGNYVNVTAYHYSGLYLLINPFCYFYYAVVALIFELMHRQGDNECIVLLAQVPEARPDYFLL